MMRFRALVAAVAIAAAFALPAMAQDEAPTLAQGNERPEQGSADTAAGALPPRDGAAPPAADAAAQDASPGEGEAREAADAPSRQSESPQAGAPAGASPQAGAQARESGQAAQDRTAPQAAGASSRAASVPPADRALRPVSIGVLADAPPFSSAQRFGGREGFDVDLVYGICSFLKRRCDLVPMERDQLVEALHDRRLDAIVASDSRPERVQAFADFSDPYLSLAARFVLPRSSSADLETGSKLPYGAIADTSYAAYLEETYTSPGSVALYVNPDAMWIDLALGRLQGVLVTAVKARNEFLGTPLGKDFRLSANSLTDATVRAQDATVAVRKGEPALLSEINAAIDQYLKTPEYTESLNRHLSGGLASKPTAEPAT